MKTVKELPDGRTEVGTIIHGCNVTVVFAREDDLDTMKTVTDLIMSAYAERRAAELRRAEAAEVMDSLQRVRIEQALLPAAGPETLNLPRP